MNFMKKLTRFSTGYFLEELQSFASNSFRTCAARQATIASSLTVRGGG